jgi:hypothetical protein
MKWWFYFFLKVVIAKGRKLRKSGGGDLDVNKKNVGASDQGVVEQNVIGSDQAITEQNVIASYQGGLLGCNQKKGDGNVSISTFFIK